MTDHSKKSKKSTGIKLDLTGHTREERTLADFISRRLIGQSGAIEAAIRIKTRATSPFKETNKCAGVYYFVGEPGVGKDELMKLLALYTHGDERAYVKLDGGSLADKHYAAKLIGAPTGYKGYQDPEDEEKERIAFEERVKNMAPDEAAKHYRKNPRKLLSRVNLEASKRGSKAPIIFLFISEVEKMDQSIDDLFLNAIEDGFLSLGDNEEVDFSDVVIVMAGNTGSQDAVNLKESIGFVKENVGQKEAAKKEVMLSAMQLRHRPEFFDRIDEIIYFETLKQEDLRLIVDLRLRDVIKKFMEVMERGKAFTIEIEDSAVDFILSKSLEEKGNARKIKRTVKRYFTDELERLVAKIKEQEDGFFIMADDLVKVSYEGGERLSFTLYEDEGTPATCDTITTNRKDTTAAQLMNAKTRVLEAAARRASVADKKVYTVSVKGEDMDKLHVEMAYAMNTLKNHLYLEVLTIITKLKELEAVFEVEVTEEQLPYLIEAFAESNDSQEEDDITAYM